jgi:antitoxin HicB
MTNNEKLRYSMLIQWSDEDNAYLVTLPEWPNVNSGGPHTHGDTYEEAAKNGREVLELLIETNTELGDPIPEPDVYISDEEADKIDRKWDELLASPESQAYAAKMAAKLEADRKAGRLIPGCCPGLGEFTDELELAVKTLIGKVLQGMMERNQTYMAVWIHERLDELTEDDEEEQDVSQ